MFGTTNYLFHFGRKQNVSKRVLTHDTNKARSNNVMPAIHICGHDSPELKEKQASRSPVKIY